MAELNSVPVWIPGPPDDEHVHMGELFISGMKTHGQCSQLSPREQKIGSQGDGEIQMAPLNTNNPLFRRTVTKIDFPNRTAGTREIGHLSRMPDPELNPASDLNEKEQIPCLNKHSLHYLIKDKSDLQLELFPLSDIRVILSHITVTDAGVEYRFLLVDPICIIGQVPLIRISQDVRIPASDSTNVQRMDYVIRGEAVS